MQPSPPRRHSAINITPYIDILLVLLIIFMVVQSSPSFQHAARVPDDSTQLPPVPPLLVNVDGEWQITVDGAPVALNQFGEHVFERLRVRPDRSVMFRADPEIPFGMVARLIDMARGAGAETIGIS